MSDLTAGQYDLADAIELVMETRPAGYLWTPSEIARKLVVPARAHQVRAVLTWMEQHVFVTSNERGGAWRRFARRH